MRRIILNIQNKNLISEIISVKEMKKLKQKSTKRLIYKVISSLLILVFIAWFTFNWVAENAINKMANNAEHQLKTVASLQQNDNDFFKNIVTQLVNQSELQRFIMDRNNLSKGLILNNWISVAEQINWISHIRYIDNSGFEILRVENDRQTGFAMHTNNNQNQKNSAYFQQAILLPKNELYISPIELNREYQELSYPLSPVVHFATPIFQPSGQVSGIVVVDFYADKLISLINDIVTNVAGSTLLLDQQGHYLQGFTQQQHWAHELSLDNEEKFSLQYPLIWQELSGKANGIVAFKGDRFVFRRLSFNEDVDHPDHYFVLQHISERAAKQEYASDYMKLYLLFFSLMLLTILSIWSFYKRRLVKEVEHNSLELISALFYSQEAIFITDSVWKITVVNHAFCESTGYSVADVEGKAIADLYFINETELLTTMATSIAQTGCWLGEVSSMRKDATLLTSLLLASAVKNKNGDISHYVLQMVDITQRKTMENELRIAAAAFDTRSAISITDTKGNIIRVNQAFTAITGYSAEEVIGKNPRILSSGKHDSRFYRQMWHTIIVCGFWQGEIWNRHKDGEVFPEWITISSIKDEQGKVIYYVATFEDISERKRLEALIAQLSQGCGVVQTEHN